MDIRFQTNGADAWHADVLLLFCFKGEDVAQSHALMSAAAPWFSIAPALRDFDGRSGQQTLLYGPPAFPLPRILLLGLGERNDCNPDVLRRAMGTAVRSCREMGLESMALCFETLDTMPIPALRVLEESVLAALQGLYRFNRFQTPAESDTTDPRWLAICVQDAHVPDAVHSAARRAEAAFAGLALARDLGNMPANILSPVSFAEEAEKVAKRHSMRCEVLDATQMKEMGMGAFIAVGQGSAQEPRLVLLEHCPPECADQQPLVFVGKGLTFDSGGISLKPAKGMEEMKSDMAGAAAVLGLFEALGQANIARRVVGVLGCAENMPGASATRPGDVVRTLSGKTVEIANTDAEGRLVLADALTFVQQRFEPSFLIDIATLTGACVVALGSQVAGLFCKDASLAERVRGLGEVVGERFWPLPLDDLYKENIKSEIADISNTGPREGGASNAAVFLQHFVKDGVRWAHLDIAGPAWSSKKTPNSTPGATGFGVRTLFEMVVAS